ncbi:hypothetical protein CTRC69_01500 [Chlamydia trachomatis RC-F/69]|nr:hypothetical protein CTRC69_01500 [Chlamydia trachomatis RC-F/69]AGR94624.1 hypothetical protein CTRC46_01480 [Chlamydia trachomatis RC-L2(s)/46]AGR95545.1 hypothetical protein CTRC852_01520 [Chlamydia trachomatis RC-F(s)/852]AGR99264.1 hypothetical protein CTRC342_01520 [Chlamydia trachomatis RC-F(s)/342]AGS03965.1 hypothetical protein CTRC55_01485 [Chlamydia trachomatis RC-L2/55]
MLAKKQDQKNLFLKPPLLNLNYKKKNQFNFSKKKNLNINCFKKTIFIIK